MPFNILVVMEKNSWVNEHIANSLELMGHVVTRFYFGDYVGEFYKYRRRHEQLEKNHGLLNLARTLHSQGRLDLIFCYVFDDFLLPKTAKALENLNVPMVNYSVDMPIQWYRQIRTAKYFDLMLCAQPTNMNNLAKYAKKVFYFPMAAQPRVIHTYDDHEEKESVSFLGTAMPYRRYLFSKLSKSFSDFSIYGKNWDNWEVMQSNIAVRSTERTLHDLYHYAYPLLRSEGLHSLRSKFINRFFFKR